MHWLRKNGLFFLLHILNFYALPFWIRDTGSGMALLLVIMPVICLIVSVAFGWKNGFALWYAPAVAVLFVPSLFVFYNESAWVYALVFGAVACAGNGLGRLFYRAP